jgi:1-acyl-sn-glycerol-3-phosphate acyltransferase
MLKALRTILSWAYFVWAYSSHFYLGLLFFKPFCKNSVERHHFAAIPFLKVGNKLLDIKLEIKGAQHVPMEGPFIIASNHQSFLDIAAFVIAVPRKFSFFAKKELGKIPIIAGNMKLLEYFLIDRKNPKESMKDMEHVRESMATGKYNLLVYPEGTRSSSGDVLPFKRGAFIVALQTGIPIIPACVDGGYKVVNKDSWVVQPGTISLTFAAPIQVEKETDKAKIKEGSAKLAKEVEAIVKGLQAEMRTKN